ncbi:MAG: hypothetical protein K5888_11100 [Lachnospiraceae bacterium]|nr:hypothetical protein [Lachnospiraceae bacterium]
MEFSADANGITVKKLFGKTVITYPEIESIIESDGRTTVDSLTTINLKSGKMIERNAAKALTEEYPVIFDAIERYNIEFKNTSLEAFVESGEAYTIEDIRAIYSSMEPKISEYSNKYVAEKIGPEYSVKLVLKEYFQYVKLHLVLLKNGSVVMVPDVAKNEESPEMPESFENHIIASLYHWDASYRYGKFFLDFDYNDAGECEYTYNESLEDFCNYYIPE